MSAVDFDPPSTSITWLPDGKHYLQTRDSRLHKVDALTGRSSRYPEREKLAESLAADSLDGTVAAPVDQPANEFQLERRQVGRADCPRRRSLPLADGRLAGSAPHPARAARSNTPSTARTGDYVAYVRGRNLYITDIATQTEQAITRRYRPSHPQWRGIVDLLRRSF